MKPQFFLCATIKTNHELWHKRVGHPSNKVLGNILDLFLRYCISCDTCKISPKNRLPFPLSLSKSERLFDLVYSDVWSLASIISYNGFKFFVTFIDDFSRATWLYLLK